MKVTVECEQCDATIHTFLYRDEGDKHIVRQLNKKNWQYIEASTQPGIVERFWRCPNHHMQQRPTKASEMRV